MTLPTDKVADRMMMEVHYYTPYQFTLMDNFYRSRREALGILMAEDSKGAWVPEGGRFNFDHDNRQPPPKGQDSLGVEPPW